MLIISCDFHTRYASDSTRLKSVFRLLFSAFFLGSVTLFPLSHFFGY
jgi:hypothetical protein